ncbi:hypothetical protein GUY44_07510 [Pimelobacter simplex]|uniref:Uncharacterized protein n=1 Tax=Nocardioides simplex TaxID=2045 RepID=A0A0A1DF27_NOCSI|nr:hypothetical protein [Pimelobacter simplex]AIY15826.1 hypothetical protein KR76_01860 [Pimelobacter simplex]MCG8150321.1 hypothetical protein [Pimelobacter simplex]GEB16687.1 hypothetical protein NSI01_50020 [Pimelobacter simplex]SFM90001.1 hypothetical protein SAMN05421671_4096 [Pimelobacter simplex]
MPEYRIEFQIQRRDEAADEDDFTEIGFGSSGGCGSLDGAVYALESYVCNGQWETEPGQPDPDEILAEIRKARA